MDFLTQVLEQNNIASYLPQQLVNTSLIEEVLKIGTPEQIQALVSDPNVLKSVAKEIGMTKIVPIVKQKLSSYNIPSEVVDVVLENLRDGKLNLETLETLLKTGLSQNALMQVLPFVTENANPEQLARGIKAFEKAKTTGGDLSTFVNTFQTNQ